MSGLPVTMCTHTAPADQTDDSGDAMPPSTKVGKTVKRQNDRIREQKERRERKKKGG